MATRFLCGVALGLGLLAGCASIQTARMALPAELAALQPLALEGIGWGRSGRFAVAGDTVRFDRGAARLSLLEKVSWDTVDVNYTLEPVAGSPRQARCQGQRTELSAGIVAVDARALSLRCQWSGGSSAQMTLTERRSGVTARQQREGRYSDGTTTLTLRSLHALQGTALSTGQPAGYVFEQEGRVVGALELIGGQPRLWRPGAGSADVAQAVTQAAVALALLWDPAEP